MVFEKDTRQPTKMTAITHSIILLELGVYNKSQLSFSTSGIFTVKINYTFISKKKKKKWCQVFRSL